MKPTFQTRHYEEALTIDIVSLLYLSGHNPEQLPMSNFTVHRSLVSAGTRKGVYVTEASTLGLRPGQWPDRIAVVGLGLFVAGGGCDDAVAYLTTDGSKSVIVFND